MTKNERFPHAFIAPEAFGAHHYLMQRDERFFSRGNTAVAALLLVTLIGAGAFALDSMRGQNAKSQLAEVGATQATYEPPVNTAKLSKEDKDEITRGCTMGYDYVVRINKNKETIIKPTLDGKNEVTLEKGNQCEGIAIGTALKDGRKCDQNWADEGKCKVYVCTPKEVTVDGKAEECFQTTGGGDLDRDYLKGELAARIATNIDEASPERAKAIASATAALDSQISQSVLDMNGGSKRFEELNAELEAQKANYERAKEENEDALNALKKCSGIGSTGPFSVSCSLPAVGACASQLTAACNAEKDFAIQKTKYENLANQAQPLKELQGGIAPGTDPDTGKIANCPGGPGCQGGAWDPAQKKLVEQTFTKPPPGDPGPAGPGNNTPANSNSSNGNPMSSLGQLLPLLTGLLSGATQQAPTCTISVSPKNVTQPGQQVTVTWQSQNAQAAYISTLGQVGPSGSTTITPQQTTTITMQVIGYPPQNQQQQQYNPYTGYGGTQGQYVWNPQLGAYVYTQGQAQQNPYTQIGQQIGQLVGGGGAGQQQAQCSAQVTVGAQGSGTGDKPKAQISCQPKIADVGMQVAISYACQNSATSKGEGFSTSNELSGSANATVVSPSTGSTNVTYGVTCSKEGQTDSAQCTVNVNKPSIVLVANPKNVKSGETSNIGWVTGAMESCVVSSPSLAQFTDQNKNNTSASGVAKTPPLTQNTKFILTCTTKAGGTKTAETTVEIGN